MKQVSSRFNIGEKKVLSRRQLLLNFFRGGKLFFASSSYNFAPTLFSIIEAGNSFF
jgi:hypothetical protein